MAEEQWLIEEVKPLDEEAVARIARGLPPRDVEGDWRGALYTPTLAVYLQDIIVHDTRKWFGEADIRLDALVVSGYGQEVNPQSFYMPGTFRFSRVRDGDRLNTGDEGLTVFHGKAAHFLDIFIMASRDRKDAEDLAGLLAGQLQSDQMKGALGTLLGLTIAAPQVNAVTAAIGAAAVLGNFVYQVLRNTTGATIGLYRGSLLQHRDLFGIGPHPKEGSYRVNDLSFRYEVLLEEEALPRE
ncbi:MAG: hypothetical protein L0177_20400 [Chloroflexi bacterium]|nr:hypothetical protein [Chloroflexota bacterium]